MNKFAQLILIQQFKKVCYYSVILDEEDESQFKQFVDFHSDAHKQKLNHILSWIEKIGNHIGARDGYFRNEAKWADARALPPKGRNRKPVYIELDEITGEERTGNNNLRLYCFRANEHVVILFNGGIKTKNDPEDCENVKQHFENANLLAVALEKAFRGPDPDIRWNSEYTNIEVADDFLLYW